MKNSIFTTLFMLLAFNSFTQQRVALQSGGVTTIYSSVDPFVEAYNNAVNGDTIYLSGGGFTAPATIDKGVTIFGAGFHPDSTSATYLTIFTSATITIGPNADNLYMEGIQMSTLQKPTSSVTNNVSLVRCRINNLYAYGSGVGTSLAWAIIQNVIGECDMNGVISSVFTNNIVTGRFEYSANNLVTNNLFKFDASATYYTLRYCDNNTFANNVFHDNGPYICNPGTGNIFENNVFMDLNPALGVVPIDNNNYKGIDLTTVFVNQTGYAFDYAHDYHLQAAAALLYLGNNGTEVGIYGGTFPMKEGMVPQNPHISTKLIAPQTAPNGDLNIQIQVNAQDN